MKQNGITRRQALFSIATISAGALIRPSSAFCSPAKDKLRFAVVGDWGTGNQDQVRTVSQMFSSHQRTAFDFVISAGDNVYPNGSGRYFGKHFEQPFADFLKNRINFYTVLGNHDVDAGRQDQCQYPLFNMGGKSYYTFEQGDGLAEFFMLDSTDFDGSQAAWLETSLKASRAKWKIAVFHHPIYSSGKAHGSAVGLRKQLEPLFTKYDVKVGLSGHDHIYERIRPQQTVQYFVTGAGAKCRRGSIDSGTGFTAASFDEDNHYMVIEIDDKQISYEAISERGTVVDRGTIK